MVYVAAGLGVLLGIAGVVFKVQRYLSPERRLHFSLVSTVLDGVGGFLFLGAGVLAHHRRPASRVGLLMVLVGAGSFTEDLQLSSIGWLHQVGLPLARASSGFATHLVLAFPSGRLTTRLERLLVGTAYIAVFVVTPVGALWNYPPVADVLAPAVEITAVPVAVGVVAVLVRRWLCAGRPMRWVLVPLLLSVPVAGAATVVYGVLDSTDPLLSTLRWIYQVGFALLPLGFLAQLMRVRLGRTAVGALLARLREPLSASQLRAALAHAVGDPSLQVGYWWPDAEVFVDGDGVPLRMPGIDSGRAVTPVERGGRRVAVLVHDAALREDAHVLDAVTGAAGLALENQHLAAEVRAQLGEVRASRGRIVAAADAERRRLERDLHDGAQQRLVTVALSLRLAQQRLDGVADAAAVALLANGVAGLDAAIGELRELARGIHPAILTDAGLVPALQALVERTPSDVRLTAEQMPRLGSAVAATGYFVVAEALTNVLKHAQADHTRITVVRSGGRLRVEVSDDGVGGADTGAGSGLLGMRDRVSALDGTLTVHSVPGRGTCVSAVIPCGQSETGSTLAAGP